MISAVFTSVDSIFPANLVAGDISIEDMWMFEQDCHKLDVRQCETTRPDDKLRLIRAVSSGHGGSGWQ